MVNTSLKPQIDPSKMASVVASSSDTKWNLHFFVMVYMETANDKNISDARWQTQGPKLLEPTINGPY